MMKKLIILLSLIAMLPVYSMQQPQPYQLQLHDAQGNPTRVATISKTALENIGTLGEVIKDLNYSPSQLIPLNKDMLTDQQWQQFVAPYLPHLESIALAHDEQEKKQCEQQLENAVQQLSNQDFVMFINIADCLDIPLFLNAKFIEERLKQEPSYFLYAPPLNLPYTNERKVVEKLSENALSIYRSKNMQLLHTLTDHHANSVYSVAFSPDSNLIASGCSDRTIKLWNVATGSLLRTLRGYAYLLYSVSFSPDGITLASGSGDDTIKLWNAATGNLLRTLTGHANPVFSVAFSHDGITLASGSGDDTIKLWNAATGNLLRTLTGHANPVFSVAFSHDGITLASGSGDDTIKLWNAATGNLLRTLTGHANSVYSVAFNPNGNLIASGSNDKTIKLWNVATGSLLRTLTGHANSVYSVAFSPDGITLASGSGDDTIKLWNAATGNLLRTLTGHANPVFSVAFSHDGITLASGSGDDTIKLWDASIPDQAKQLTLLQALLLHCVQGAPFVIHNDAPAELYNTFDPKMQQFIASTVKQHNFRRSMILLAVVAMIAVLQYFSRK